MIIWNDGILTYFMAELPGQRNTIRCKECLCVFSFYLDKGDLGLIHIAHIERAELVQLTIKCPCCKRSLLLKSIPLSEWEEVKEKLNKEQQEHYSSIQTF